MTYSVGQKTETKVVWPCPKVFLLSKDNSAGHNSKKKKKGYTEEGVGKQY